jgi:uncharacterized protein (TIGR00297 family)
MSILWGLLFASAISLAALRLGSLSRSGAAAAIVLGTLVFGLGGLEWAILLVAFFVSSSGLSHLFKNRKQNLTGTFSKGAQRDAGQVLANGGFAGLAVLIHAIRPELAWPWIAFSGILAAVNADTWATELGVLSPTRPRLITTLQPVEHGTSGGISLAGTLASLAGALLVGLLSVLFRPSQALLPLNAQVNLPPAALPALAGWLIVGGAGLLGSLVDSLLGATLQAIYYCPACDKETERHPLHTCGGATTLRRGLPWLDNDGVNAACGLLGGLAALVFYL